ncbi:MAG TPA: rhomboid family intramembrane serine protease [Actinophytocola sp.]|uniref:rhomboid family intramembrane serine protease n=1 Tax=Actinophytocola sp. TaxID=1872138 RepID=UPI002DB7B5CF|nr:rhomboid family intramembrane serine protease [Actinophytocola sp.]HEU5473144.1 rhomboid family intramembrane serine protease [Actinophytocola sp.]
MGTPPEPPQQWGTQAAMPACVRHPDRPTGLRCTRCDRPACPECLREASVGYQCVDCVNEGRRTIRHGTTIAGAPSAQRPVVMPVLVVLNLGVFAITAAQAGSIVRNQLSELFVDWMLVPALVSQGEWWRLITAGFLHYGPVHIALNMIALYLLGRDLEPVLGRVRFTAVYLVSLLGGSVAVFLFGGLLTPVAGASGAVFGLMGGLAVVVLRLRIPPGPVLGIIALNVFISVTVPGISLLGHLGGLVVGAIATAAMVYAPRQSRTAWQVGTIATLVVVLVSLIFIRDAALGQLVCDFRSGVCFEVDG